MIVILTLRSKTLTRGGGREASNDARCKFVKFIRVGRSII